MTDDRSSDVLSELAAGPLAVTNIQQEKMQAIELGSETRRIARCKAGEGKSRSRKPGRLDSSLDGGPTASDLLPTRLIDDNSILLLTIPESHFVGVSASRWISLGASHNSPAAYIFSSCSRLSKVKGRVQKHPITDTVALFSCEEVALQIIFDSISINWVRGLLS